MQVEIDGKNIYYEELGEGTVPVVLLHGWLATLETMRPIANGLLSNFKVYLVDIVGFGKSDEIEKPMNTDDYGNFVKSFLEKLKIENPILIGHSNGGRAIINAVGRGLVNPRKIILIDSAGIKPHRSIEYYIKVGIAKCGKAVLGILPGGKKLIEKLKSGVGSEDYKNSSPALKETMKTILNEDLTNILSNINVPTLLFWGGQDNATPIEDGRKMEKLIPDCGLVEYPNAGHFSYLENIENVKIVINEFLKNDHE